MHKVMNIPPLRLVLSGGGIKGLSYVGAFKELESLGYLKNINEILGVSCGALFGFAHIIGYTTKELFHLASSMDFSLIQNIEPEIAFSFLDNYGIDDGLNLEKFIESLLKNKEYSKDITFKELYEKTNIIFRCYAVQLNQCLLQEFSYNLTPDTSVIFGLRASMCIPGYFIPLKDKTTIYVDGGLMNNYPINLVKLENQDHTLGFAFSEDHTNIESINSIHEFFNQIFASSYMLKKKEILLKYKKNTIIIPCGEFPLWKFNASYEERLYLIECGQKAVKTYYNEFVSNKPIRRYSVG